MSRSSRRKLLKGIALSLPAAWSTPVVQSVILPAHAQTSGDESESQPEDGRFAFGFSSPLTRNLLNWFVPTAHAVSGCDPRVVCATLQDGVLAISLAYDLCCCYRGSGNLDGGSISISTDDGVGCSSCGPYTAELVELTGIQGARTLKLSIDGKAFELAEETAGDCSCGVLYSGL